ncbi:hypothetical protein [Pontibacter akesuensis]|uniref:Uncharacterized protein n=1 Tax=Pontibacter akesuensis TaxID=388950 RepID=A0A1I7JXF5_9BACT|nr:hypothetical protein [Pontibacter akesuensis]GHA76798.1 hypothetical protein GCM10007389_33490 [Pontibacter akesuensis]SFU89877.1 hypothetical protein SAMN04487941_3153 [Pontibacter akesuensis]
MFNWNVCNGRLHAKPEVIAKDGDEIKIVFTKTIENFHRQVRKGSKTKRGLGHAPAETDVSLVADH